jgi:enoyl-CoA hydratase
MIENLTFYKVVKETPLAWVYLNRPEKKNAMGPAAWTEIAPIFEELDKDDDIRAIIIAGEGKDLTAGIDLIGMADSLPSLKAWDMSAGARMKLFKIIFPMQDAMSCIEKCSKPVICAMHGFCIGAGLDLASACDIRLASQDVKISLREAAVAIVADVGSLQRVPHIVGQGIARELAYTAKFIDAKRAKEVLLVNEVYPDKDALMAAAKEMALEIAGNSPLAVSSAKDVLNYCRGKSIADGLEYVAARSSMILPSDDLAETMTAFMERRKPVFKGK